MITQTYSQQVTAAIFIYTSPYKCTQCLGLQGAEAVFIKVWPGY